MVNKVQGKGFEDERNYSNTRFHFFDIENIHVMRSSQQKLIEGSFWQLSSAVVIVTHIHIYGPLACYKCRSMSEYLRTLESSGWLKHLRAIVECSTFLAESISR
ncbi:hypothetical protein ANCDUO_27133, partial [Ancylostoma duodenale]